MTQQCNLRCEYCAYSGIYDNRTHSNKRMSFETAKKSIDFFLDHSRDSESIAFGFYGGEPLLEASLIEKCIDYINKNVEGKEVNYKGLKQCTNRSTSYSIHSSISTNLWDST